MRLQIERQSPPLARDRSMRDSGIATMTTERAEQACLSGEGADDTVVMLNARGQETPQTQTSNTGFITMRKPQQNDN